MKRFRLPGLLGLVVVTGSCTVGPEYERPEVEVPDAFRFEADGALNATDSEWWVGFDDPVLEELVDESLLQNLDVRVAAARVDEFLAKIGLTRSDAFPQVSGSAAANRSRNSEQVGATGGSRVSDFFEANLNAGWELDVFGRIQSATDAAAADALAAEEDRRGVILSLVASVATTYIGIRSLDEQLLITQEKVATRQQTVELFELQCEKGVISRLELSQVRSELERAAGMIPALERDIAIMENALSVLLGRPPGMIERGRSLMELRSPAIPGGLPSELLQRRPDVRQAEQRIVAANRRVGVAVASFYPSFSLTASLGLASDELAQLFDPTARTYSLGAGILAPLFTAGFLEGQLGVAEAVERQAIESYRGVVLTALREAEDALVTRSTTLQESVVQERQVEALRDYATLARQRYDNGFVGYLEVLDAERDLFDAELQEARLRASLLASVVGLYKAMGGGWVERAEETAAEGEASE